MIDIQIDSTNVINALKRLEQATLKRAPLMRSIAGIMADAVEENFAQQGRPKWQGLKPPGRPGGQILQKSGRLAASITPASDADSAQVGTNVKYAAIHQFGGKTAAHEIRPRHAKALRFGGRFAKKVNHPGSDIPARPFLALGETDLQDIEDTVSDYLRAALGE
ncbi:phage virion morphogenesis protein [Craterilacuibacter sinensis]|uniref:Phage virion morphogenesis protein n=1 Tax=Craterilacuibacter sinensis TaxID=2686017 RepID=A0A845BNF6_9NEIS|nr:phage virion morphogenesis protein [Craterilacuibacter sinensis]MXR36718.1 phage virion morphogenesis protein [Craterilacuibacter sinensis]